jgi:hypothetical protein
MSLTSSYGWATKLLEAVSYGSPLSEANLNIYIDRSIGDVVSPLRQVKLRTFL